jgi:hypothetical protein
VVQIWTERLRVVPMVGCAEIITRWIASSFKKKDRRFAWGVGESMGEETT